VTEAEYATLVSACDALLCAPPLTYEKVAVAWLHVRSEHPNNTSQYQRVFDRPGLLPELGSKLRSSAAIARTLVRSLVSERDDRLSDLPAAVDVLFLSHLVSAQARPDSPDFYYGDLPEQLAARGLSTLVALQSQLLSDDTAVRARLTRGGTASRIVLPRRSTFRQESHFVRRARCVARDLLRQARIARDSFDSSVAREAARQAASGSTIAALRFHADVKRICARFRPRAVFVTWEGHCFERLAFCAARSVDPGVRCVGYQHTVLFPRAHALKRPLGREYDPDALLTLGDVTRDILKGCEGLSRIPIMTYGSHRRPNVIARRAPDAAARCLVIPEGLELECLTLFDFALAAAARMRDVEFVLRMHPVFPFEGFARQHARFRALPANVRVSAEADINADFARCDWALYRGSSAVVHAVLTGVRPLYLQRPGEMTIDPLFTLHDWRRHVATVEALESVITADRAARPEERLREWEPARSFCARYVVSPNPDIVHSLLTH